MTKKFMEGRENDIKIDLEELMWKKRVKSVTQLSIDTKISRQTLHKILSGDAMQIDLRTITSLCKALDCKIDELIVFKDGQVS